MNKPVFSLILGVMLFVILIGGASAEELVGDYNFTLNGESISNSSVLLGDSILEFEYVQLTEEYRSPSLIIGCNSNNYELGPVASYSEVKKTHLSTFRFNNLDLNIECSEVNLSLRFYFISGGYVGDLRLFPIKRKLNQKLDIIYGLTDLNNNSLYDRLSVSFEVNISESGTYTMAYSHGNRYNFKQYDFDVGVYNITLEFEAFDLYFSKFDKILSFNQFILYMDGNYLIDPVFKWNNLEVETNLTYLDFEKIEFAVNPINSNSNSLYDKLEISFEVGIPEKGKYSFSYESNGIQGRNHYDFDIGTYNITLEFGSSDLHYFRFEKDLLFSSFYLYRSDVREGVRIFDWGSLKIETNLTYENFERKEFGFSVNDLDNNYLYDEFVLKTEVDIPEDGYYIFDTELRIGNDGVESYFRGYLNKGFNSIELKFKGEDIYLTKFEDELTFSNTRLYDKINRRELWEIQKISVETNLTYENFEKPSIVLGIVSERLLDLNENNLTDYLELGIEVEIKTEGDYGLSVRLNNNKSSISEYFHGDLEPGIQTIYLNFSGIKINSLKENSSFIVDITLDKEDSNEILLFDNSSFYETKIYNYTQFEKAPIGKILGISDAEFIDSDSNNFTDYIQVEVLVNVSQDGFYKLRSEWVYYDEKEKDEYDLDADTEMNLTKGENIIFLKINSRQLASWGAVENLSLDDLDLLKDNFWIDIGDYDKDFMITDINYKKFEKPSEIISISYEKIINDDGDELFDGLAIGVLVNIVEDAECRINLELEDEYGNEMDPRFRKNLYAGEQIVDIFFYGEDFYDEQVRGNLTVSNIGIRCNGIRKNSNLSYTTNSYNFEDFERPSYFEDFKELNLLDLDQNGFYEKIIFDALVNISLGGEYEVMVELSEKKVEIMQMSILQFKFNFLNSYSILSDDKELNYIQVGFKTTLAKSDTSLKVSILGEDIMNSDLEGDLVLKVELKNKETNVTTSLSQDINKEIYFLDFEPFTGQEKEAITPPTNPNLQITLLSPEDDYTKKTSSDDHDMDFEFEVQSDYALQKCELYIDSSLRKTFTSPATNAILTYEKNLDRDDYHWHVKCIDIHGNTAQSEKWDFEIKRKSSSRTSSSNSKDKSISINPVKKLVEPVQGIIHLNRKTSTATSTIAKEDSNGVIRLTGMATSNNNSNGFLTKFFNWLLELFS